MKYVKLFEKWGISDDLKDFTMVCMKEIHENPKKNKFSQVHKINQISYPFKIIIKKDLVSLGQYSYYDNPVKGDNSDGPPYNMRIYLKDRHDFSTLLHEIKHLDKAIRQSSPFNKLLRKGLKSSEEGSKLKTLFYCLDDDEFEAKYHGYYVKISFYLYNNLEENPTNDDVFKSINYYLNNLEEDLSFTYWTNSKYLKLTDYTKTNELYDVFDKMINGGNYTYGIIPKKIGDYLRKKFNIRNNQNKREIERIIVKTEKLLNRNKIKYRRKFLRLYTLMVDKYVK
tara:strand:+ start:115168 stop:116016 length:849 start_codon:yes stop_codon:yes gene_type:complete